MKKMILECVTVLCVAGFISNAQALTVTTNAVEDTYVRGGIYAHTNYNDASELQLKYHTGSMENTREIYYKFDLAALTNLPGVIESATIELYRSNGSGGQPIHAVCETFTDLAWSANDITWSNPPAMAISQFPSQTDYNPRASEFANDMTPGETSWFRVDFTDRLNEYVDAGRTGVTVHIYGGTPNSSPYAYFIALEHGSTDKHPRLEVVCRTYPVGLAAAAPVTGGGVTVSWRAYPQATGYTLEMADSEDGPWTTESVSGTSHVDTGISYGSLRYYRVTATLPVAQSDTSPVVRCVGQAVRAALADTYVDSSNKDDLYGEGEVLRVKNSGGVSYHRESLLRFNVAGLGAASARLRIYHGSTTGDNDNPSPFRSNGLIVLRKVDDTGWDEGSVTWNTLVASGFTLPNNPGASLISGEICRFYTAGTNAKWFDLDVSDVVNRYATNGVVMFELCAAYQADGGSLFLFSSKEAGATAPELIVSGRPFGQPGPVSAVSTNTTATLSWEGLLEAKSYRILKAAQASGPFSLLGTTTDTVYEDSSLVYGFAAYYRIEPVAVDDSLGPQSESVEVFPLVTEILSPTADAHVQYNEDKFMGALPTIWVKRYNGYDREGFLQFDITNLPARVYSNAVLRIVAATQEANVDRSNTQVVIERIEPFAWIDATLNWSLATANLSLPTSTGYVPTYELARFQAEDADLGTVYEFDVSSQLTAARRAGDQLQLHVYVATANPANSAKSLTFFSKESSVESYRPTLTCTYNPRSFGTLILLR
ncbi:MAG: DNRLRE domain-containing protein [Kiritimatiellae bacterium]|jgi:hypothetical protein|nr:DNRLRE domain-containing protein [Kiritimatiellia bacterium]